MAAHAGLLHVLEHGVVICAERMPTSQFDHKSYLLTVRRATLRCALPSTWRRRAGAVPAGARRRHRVVRRRATRSLAGAGSAGACSHRTACSV